MKGSVSTAEPIFVIAGATSQIGNRVVRQLCGAGCPVRALSRGPVSSLEGLPGVEVVTGFDMSDVKSIPIAFAGGRPVAGALLLAANFEGQLEGELAFLQAASAAKVPYIVKISTWQVYIDEGLDVLYAKWHGEVEKKLQDDGTAYTSLRPCWFQQNLGRGANLPLLRDSGKMDHPTNTKRCRMVDSRDVGNLAAKLLLLPAEQRRAHVGKHYTVSGPEGWSMKEIADLVAQHRPAESNEISLQEFADRSVAVGDSKGWKARAQMSGWRDCWMQGKFDKPSSPEVLALCPPRRTVPMFIAETMPELLEPKISGEAKL